METRDGERPVNILLIEDNPGDIRLTQEAFEMGRIHNDLRVVTRGADALDYLHRRGEYTDATQPDLVLLDLQLPDMDGMDILEEIQDSPDLKIIPVIVLTSSDAASDIVKSYERQANAYLTKPPDADEFIKVVRGITRFWLQMVELPP